MGRAAAVTQSQVWSAIKAERKRQQKKFRDRSIAGPLPLDTKYRILGEEVGEVAQAIDIFESAPCDLFREKLRAELVQVAACAVGMLEAL